MRQYIWLYLSFRRCILVEYCPNDWTRVNENESAPKNSTVQQHQWRVNKIIWNWIASLRKFNNICLTSKKKFWLQGRTWTLLHFVLRRIYQHFSLLEIVATRNSRTRKWFTKDIRWFYFLSCIPWLPTGPKGSVWPCTIPWIKSRGTNFKVPPIKSRQNHKEKSV